MEINGITMVKKYVPGCHRSWMDKGKEGKKKRKVAANNIFSLFTNILVFNDVVFTFQFKYKFHKFPALFVFDKLAIFYCTLQETCYVLL